MSDSGSKQLDVNDFRIAYQKDIEILRGVSLRAEAGSVTGVIGPNGAGKSTLLKGIAGLAPCVGGTVTISGQPIAGTPGQRLQEYGIAFVPQEHSLFPEMSVWENLRLGGWLNRRDKAWLKRRMDACCDLFPEISQRLTTPAGDLSGGQQRLLEIARGLMCEPAVLMLDEPTVGLSPKLADEVYHQLDSLPERAGTTIVLVDQNVRECLKVSNYVYVLLMGNNDTEGSARDISNRLEEIVQGWMQHKGSGVEEIE